MSILFFKKKYTIFLIFLFYMNSSFLYAFNINLSGQWCWVKDSKVSAFSIEIRKVGYVYQGGYGSVVQGGNKIDDNENAFTFKMTENRVIRAVLKAGITGNTGVIQIKILSKKKIEWLILQYPRGEIYVPKKAILYKCK